MKPTTNRPYGQNNGNYGSAGSNNNGQYGQGNAGSGQYKPQQPSGSYGGNGGATTAKPIVPIRTTTTTSRPVNVGVGGELQASQSLAGGIGIGGNRPHGGGIGSGAGLVVKPGESKNYDFGNIRLFKLLFNLGQGAAAGAGVHTPIGNVNAG